MKFFGKNNFSWKKGRGAPELMLHPLNWNFWEKNELSCYKNCIYHWNTHDPTFSTMYRMLNDDNAEESCQLLNFIDLLCYPSNKFSVKMKFFIQKSSENYKSWFQKQIKNYLQIVSNPVVTIVLIVHDPRGRNVILKLPKIFMKNMILTAIFASLFIFHMYQKVYFREIALYFEAHNILSTYFFKKSKNYAL